MEKVMQEILAEYERASRMYPAWPHDIVHAAAIMVEEAGETLQAANNYYHGQKESSLAMIRKEAVETAAMCLRLLLDTECYKR